MMPDKKYDDTCHIKGGYIPDQVIRMEREGILIKNINK
jgi:hypothetical protein